MDNTLIAILFGHYLGDYLFQPRHMARRKIYSPWVCVMHCAIYTACTVLSLILWDVWTLSTLNTRTQEILIFSAFVFGSHYLIDKTSFFRSWMKFVLGEDLADYINLETRSKKSDRINVVRNTFNTITYVVLDNGAHIFLSLLMLEVLFG
jgi:hypothetical protein